MFLTLSRIYVYMDSGGVQRQVEERGWERGDGERVSEWEVFIVGS